MNSIVTTQWVHDHLQDSDLRVLEVASQPASYTQAHLPGAALVLYSNVFAIPRDGLRMQIPDASQMASFYNQHGITRESNVVVYADYNDMSAARGLWAMQAYGHPNVFMMDGGKMRWQSEGRPLTAEITPIEPVDYGAKPVLLDGYRADAATVLAALDEPDTILLDARSLDEYTGRKAYAARGGRIPGAIHFEWAEALDKSEGSYLDADAVRDALDKLGVTLDKRVITYCQHGIRAAHLWLTLTGLLDFGNVQIYDGSWDEWGNRPDLPVEV